jgi:hypothetical protein
MEALRVPDSDASLCNSIVVCFVGLSSPCSTLQNRTTPRTDDLLKTGQVRFLNMVDVTPETLDVVGTCDWSVFIEQKADAKRILPLKIRVSYNALLFSRVRMQVCCARLEFRSLFD